MLSAFTFLNPALLWALAVLPLLWWLLRLMPPAPRKLIFPALGLLEGLIPEAQTPARTPWWLLLLRLAILAALISGLARPLYAPSMPASGSGPVAVLVDNGWAAASGWDDRRAWLDRFCVEMQRADRELLVLPTAPAVDGALQPVGPLPALTACQAAAKMEPQPWPVDHGATQAWLAQNLPTDAQIVWLNDGVTADGTASLYRWLMQRGSAPVIYQTRTPLMLLRPAAENQAAVERLQAGATETATVEAHGAAGDILAAATVSFAPGAKTATASLGLSDEARTRVAKLTVARQRGAQAVWLRDGSGNRPSVGLIGDAAARRNQPLLSSLYYLERALDAGHAVTVGAVADLLAAKTAVIVAAGDRALLAPERAALADWVRAGGVLIQFAGPELRQDDEQLLPTHLLATARDLGGALSWEKPRALRAFPDAGPFAGLDVPQDVTVTRQILADPAGLAAETVWAALEDGTPLVTGAARGQGLTALFHIPANPEWSNLPLSGLFVPMLERLIQRGVTGSVTRGDQPLPPWQVMDGFGQLRQPSPQQQALPVESQNHFLPSHAQPPGYYGHAEARRAFNLAMHMPLLEAFAPPEAESLPQGGGAVELRPWLLTAALLLFFLDLGLAFWLRGLLPALAAALVLMLVLPQPAFADKGVDMTRKTWLGVVRNGAGDRAAVGREGLQALAQRLRAKTSLEQADAKLVDLENEDLAFYPFLYWPLAEDPHLSAAAHKRLQDYFAQGGMLLLDLPGDVEYNAVFRASGIELPLLTPLGDDHPLYRSFYLLDDCPGRTRDGDVWSERDSAARQDGVPAVFVGSRDWAAAWAAGPSPDPQRELAFRCGINFVIYALTGNYKSDQIHLKAIMERLR